MSLTEIWQVFVVGEDMYWERGTVEVMSSRLQSMDDSEEFAIIDVIVSLSRDEQLGEV